MTRVLPLLSDHGGWRMAGPGGFRQLPNGIIESYGGPGLFWYAQEAFENFILTIEWRMTLPEDNSGVFLRVPPLSTTPQPAIERGYEVQIDDRGFDPDANVLGSAFHLTGAIYRLAPAVRRLSKPVGEWNEFEITAHGQMLAVRLNSEHVPCLQMRHVSREVTLDCKIIMRAPRSSSATCASRSCKAITNSPLTELV